MRLRQFWLVCVLPLAACQAGEPVAGSPLTSDASLTPPATAPAPSPLPDEGAQTTSDAQAVQSCASQIGAPAAADLVAQCRAVSPATRPPCNAANSCAMVRDEIARGCALLDPQAASKANCVEPGSAAAAVAVLKRYYEAIAARDYGTAYGLWVDGGRASGQSRIEFTQGFAETKSVSVKTGSPGWIEGAAGSRFVTIPVTVRSTLADGTAQRFTGEYVLRRAGAVDGSSSDQRRWHIHSATLTRG